VPRRRFIANRFGLGYQVPLGLVLVGGPLADAGHSVELLDNDLLGWSESRLRLELSARAPDCVLIGHTGSTAAHPTAMETARAVRQAVPRATIVYGGVYPTYAAADVLAENPAVDVVVRGEGEETAVELAAALEAGQEQRRSRLLAVRGITWRDCGTVITNPPRPPLADLDHFRPGWELLDWDSYRLFGMGRAAGMQFSRGCPLRCTFCGQWGFWRRWRHRTPANFVAELEGLASRHRVRVVWLADENFAADRDAAREVLELLAERHLGLSLNLNMTAADVVRDADLLPLYKRSGVDNVVLGIESLDDSTVAAVSKNNPFELSCEAVRLLRRHRIVSLVNVIYGLEEESPSTLLRTFRRLRELDADVLNAVYLTPHSWTAAGRNLNPARVIQADLARYTYRNQIIDTPWLSPWKLFLGVRLTEVLYHLRPRSLLRAMAAPDRRYRRILRAYLATGARVLLAEAAEFLFATRFVPPGTLARIPGRPRPPAARPSPFSLQSTRASWPGGAEP
jgi:anaerobic magnesium-protoporphyrin IX monomethyl ester cyclase